MWWPEHSPCTSCWAAKPRDREHPYGHGKVEFISAGIEGGLVVLAGGAIIWRAVQALLSHQQLHDLETGILLTGGAGAANLVMGLALRARGRAARSITMEASGTHLLSDAWSTVAMVVGLILIKLTGLAWLDQFFAIVFALYIIITGLRIFRRSVAGIIGRSGPGPGDHGRSIAGGASSTTMGGRAQLPNDHLWKRVAYRLSRDPAMGTHSLEQAHQEIRGREYLVNEQHPQDVELLHHMILRPSVVRYLPIGEL